MSKELKPCPFCGGDAEIVKEGHREYKPTYFVGCKICCIKTYSYIELDRAIDRWNRRVKENE